MIIAVDFDGTIVQNRYPEIGNEMPFAIPTLKMLTAEGHRLILWTVRNGHRLDEAVEWCKKRGVEFYAVNKNHPHEEYEPNGKFSVKLKADMFIDDRNVGGMLSWGTIYALIHDKTTLEDALRHEILGKEAKRRHWWWPF